VNPSTALAAVLVDELIRSGLREAVLAPGSRSAPLAMELFRRADGGGLRLHVRTDERSAAFCALGLAKASRAPVAVACTSGTAAAHFHAAVIEADEAGVPLLVLTADRPPELRGTGANQTIDQIKLYGAAVRWFCEVGVPEAGDPAPGATGPGAQAGYWRGVASRAWGLASGAAGGVPGPVHLNLALREPLVPDAADPATAVPEQLGGRPGGAPWTRFADRAELGRSELAWSERGLIICGDGDYDAAPLLALAGDAGWPVLAEPSSNARHGPNALSAYPYLLADPDFRAAHRPIVIVSAGRPGLSRGQLALLREASAVGGRHLVIAQGPGRWSDPARTATHVAAGLRLTGQPNRPGGDGWLGSWLRADRAVRDAVDAILDPGDGISEPWLARQVAAALPDGALLWAASSLPIRDLDHHLAARTGLRILASRGASGIDGLVSSAIGAALAHQAAGGGPAVALLGDLALLHDAPGLFLGPQEPRPDLCLIVVNNDGGGIFSMLEQAAFPRPFERVFGTPHGAGLGDLAAAAGLPFRRLERPGELKDLLSELRPGGTGLRLAEVRNSRADQAALRARLGEAARAAATTTDRAGQPGPPAPGVS
jgi:2-succinyl-5-enolpyruvyl-6-hydroxy-3-cyclohexene-1-carboxylate synthase